MTSIDQFMNWFVPMLCFITILEHPFHFQIIRAQGGDIPLEELSLPNLMPVVFPWDLPLNFMVALHVELRDHTIEFLSFSRQFYRHFLVRYFLRLAA